MNKFLATIGLVVLFSSGLVAQIQSNGTGGGAWNVPATWQGGVVPTSASGTITILAGDLVSVPGGFSVAIDQTTIAAGATLQIDAGGTVTVANGAGNDLTITAGSTLAVSGTLACNNLAVITGSTGTTTTFQSGGVYEHQYTTTQGVIPLAIWDATPGAASTLRIIGYTNWVSDFATGAGNWNQAFGDVLWNTTAMTMTLSMEGFLNNIDGNLSVTSTGTGILRLASTAAYTVNIDGNLTVSGNNTRLQLGTTGSGSVTLGTATAGGNFTLNATGVNGQLAVSAGTGVGTLNVRGDFTIQAGTVTKAGAGSNSVINFASGGVVSTHTFTSAGTSSGGLSYTVTAGETLILSGESQIAGNNTSTFTLGTNSILQVESTDANGAIQTGNTQGGTEGNIQTQTRTYNAGAQVFYMGSGAQFMGNGQPTVAGITTIIENNAGVTEVAASAIIISGDLTIQTGNLTISNTSLQVNGTTELQGGNILFTSTNAARTLTFNGNVILGSDLIVTGGAANATLTFAGDITGGGTISFSGVNSNLIINGIGDLVFPLAGTTGLENLTCSRNGLLSFNEILNVNTQPTTSLMSVTLGDVEVNADLNGRGITLTGASSLTVSGNTVLTNILTITSGDVRTDGTLSIGNDLILTAGTLDANGPVTITDALTLGSGTTFFFEDTSLTFSGILTNTGGGGRFSANSTSTLSMLGAGGGASSILAFSPGNTLGAFTLNRPTGGTLVTLNSPLTVETTFDLLDGGFLNTSGLAFGTGAIVTRNSAASFVVGSAIPTGGPYDLLITGGTINPTGVETQGNVEDVSITSSGTVTLGGQMLASGNVIINSGSLASGANLVSAIDFTNNGTAFTAPSTTLTINGDLSNSGTFTSNNGTVNFAGSPSAITGSVNPTFQNIIISGSLTSPATLNLAGNFTNNGSFNPNSGGVVVTSATTTTKTIGGTATTTFNNLTVQNNATANPDVSISGSAEIQGTLTLNINATLDPDGAGSGALTILSTDDDSNPGADGRIAALTGTSTITGNITVQRYTAPEVLGTTRVYRYISSPVSGQFVSNWQDDFPITGPMANPNTEFPIGSGITTICGVPLIPANASFFQYSEPPAGTGGNDLGWLAYPATGVSSGSAAITVGRGYAAFIRECTNPTIIDVTGQINFGTINLAPLVSLTVNGNPEDGYNLLGNPYPSAIDWDNAAGWTRTGISSVIAIRDNGAGGGYIYYDHTATGPFVIATGQAFWVRVTAVQPFTINELAKTSSQPVFYRTGQPDELTINLTKGAVTDKAFIKINPESVATLDDFDGPKLDNTLFDISTLSAEGISMAINSIDQVTCSSVMPMKIKDLTNGTHEFSFERLGKFVDLNIQLYDRFTSVLTNLDQTPVYSFSVAGGAADLSKAANRFELRFPGTGDIVDVNLAVSTQSQICQGENAIITVTNSQPGIDYYASLGGEKISEHIGGTGQNINLTIPKEKLALGSQEIAIIAAAACGGVITMTQQPQVLVQQTFDPSVQTPTTLCQPGSFSLQATGAPNGSTVNWYETENAINPVFSGTQFTTPVLNSTKTYYASIVSSAGCEGSRIPVETSVQQVNLELPVTVPVSICQNADALITISNSQQGIKYSVTQSGVSISDLMEGNGQDLALIIPQQNLNPGTNIIAITAVGEGTCAGTYTMLQHQIAVQQITDPSIATPAPQCQKGSFSLTATSAPAGSVVNWYETEQASTPVFSGAQFITPELTESQTYYASVVSHEGCEGNRVPVDVQVVQYQDASIAVNMNILTSNHESGNQWYRDSQMIVGATNQEFIAESTGVYKVMVSVPGNCVTSAEIAMVITGQEEDFFNSGLTVHPNPIKDFFEVKLTHDFDDQVIVMDSFGRKLGSIQMSDSMNNYRQGNFDARNLPQGVYHIKAMKATRPVFFKIIKQ